MDELIIENVPQILQQNKPLTVINKTKNQRYQLEYKLNEREIKVLLAGDLINMAKQG